MINIIKAEYLKFKGTKIFLTLIIGALLIPIIMTISHFFIPNTPTEFIESLNTVVTINLSFILLIFAVIMINSLFIVDLRNNTLKSIIPLPISRGEYLNGKLLNLFIWMIISSIISWIASIILFTIIGMQGFVLNTSLTCLWQLILGTIVIFLIMTPIVFVYLLTKNSSITILLTIALILFPTITLFGGNMLNFIQPASNYLPWSFISSLVNNTLTIEPIYAWIIVIITFIIGYGLSYWYINKKDI